MTQYGDFITYLPVKIFFRLILCYSRDFLAQNRSRGVFHAASKHTIIYDDAEAELRINLFSRNTFFLLDFHNENLPVYKLHHREQPEVNKQNFSIYSPNYQAYFSTCNSIFYWAIPRSKVVVVKKCELYMEKRDC